MSISKNCIIFTDWFDAIAYSITSMNYCNLCAHLNRVCYDKCDNEGRPAAATVAPFQAAHLQQVAHRRLYWPHHNAPGIRCTEGGYKAAIVAAAAGLVVSSRLPVSVTARMPTG